MANLDDFVGELFDEIAVVRDDDQRAAVVLERVEQHVLRVEIEVVCRLVEQQGVGRPQEHSRHGQPRAFAAREHAGLLVDLVAREQESAEDVANRRHHVIRRTRRQGLVHRQRRIEAHGFVLRKVLHHDLMAEGPAAAVWRLFAGQHAHQRRLARAVRPDQCDAIAALDVQVHVAEDREIAIRLAGMLHFEHGAPAFRAARKGEVNALPLGRHFDRDDLLEQLDSALHLCRLGRLIPEAVDEHLDARHFLILLAFRLPQAFQHRVALVDVLAVVADVIGQLAQVEISDARDDRVEKVTVVRDEDHRVRIGTEILLEPVACFEIEVIRRLVEEQQVGAAEQQLGQRDAHLPSAGERLARTIGVVRTEAEAAQDRSDAEVHVVAIRQAEAILQLRIARQHRLMLGLRHGGVAKAMLDVVHLRLDIEQRLKGAAGFLEDGAPRVRQSVLRQIPNGQVGRPDNGAGVRFIEPGQHLEEGGLAGAIRPAETHTIAVTDLPGDMLEQGAVTERFRQVGELDHS